MLYKLFIALNCLSFISVFIASRCIDTKYEDGVIERTSTIIFFLSGLTEGMILFYLVCTYIF